MAGDTILVFVLLVGVANNADNGVIIDKWVDNGVSIMWPVDTNKGLSATAFPINVFVAFASEDDTFF